MVAENHLLYFCQELLRNRGNLRVFLGYRTDENRHRQRVTEEHFRRFVNPYQLAHLFHGRDFRLLYERVGTSFAKLVAEDAFVDRKFLGDRPILSQAYV